MKKLFLVFLIVTIASILRLWALNEPDVTDDEKHYIIDAQRLLNRDSYIALRHHPFRHPEPSIGHPFLYQIESALIFKYFGLSVYTSRLPNAISGIAIVVVLLFFNKKLGGKVAILAAFLVAILPHTVRYSRNAQLDTVFSLWITLIALSTWRYLNGGKKYWLVAAGVFVGFSISTKLNGIYTIPQVLLLLIFVKWEKLTVDFVKKKVGELLLVMIPAGIVSVLLNDISAYLDGIINPSFSAYSFFSKEFLSIRVPFIFSPRSVYTFFKATFLLLSPLVLMSTVLGFYFLIFKIKGITRRFLLLWMFPLLNIFIVHGFDIEGAYGWVPLMPPAMLILSYWINTLNKKQALVLIWMIILSIMPFLFFYGLRFKSLPYKNFPATNNRIISENFYQEVVSEVNELTPLNGRAFLLPQIYYPLYALRTDISWAYYGDLESFDTYVVEKEDLIEPVLNQVELVEDKISYQDGIILNRKIYRRID